MELIPSIDLRQGLVVRLRRGDDGQRTTYDVDPRDVVAAYAEAGATRVHVVDLDAAFGEPPQRELVAQLAAVENTPPLQLGGGLRDREAIEWAFSVGIDRAVVTSLMVRDFSLFSELVGAYTGRIVAALDIDRDALKLSGWTEESPKPWRQFAAQLRSLPLAAVLVTDIQRDGTMQGPNAALACEVARACAADGLLSGGVQELADLERARSYPEIRGAIVGRALYDGAFSIYEALRACRAEVA